jgi:hypothetical protein
MLHYLFDDPCLDLFKPTHDGGAVHAHWHEHDQATLHPVTPELETAPPQHTHKHKTTARTTCS